jgi:thiol-disulfide isomerase/thioredoxin
MTNIVAVISKLIRPYKNKLITISILLIFMGVSYYYMKNRLNIEAMAQNSKDVANEIDRKKEAIIYFFHVDWCPHCKTALPEWKTFKSMYDNKTFNGYVLKCQDIDCTEETAETTTLINQFGIDSYPTVKMIRDSTTIDFDSRISTSALTSFVDTMLAN